MELSIKIKHYRKSRGYSQSYVANKLNISQRAYSKIELNETQLNWERINQISSIFNVPVWELIDSKKNHSSNPYSSSMNLLDELIKKYETRIEELETKVALLEKKLD